MENESEVKLPVGTLVLVDSQFLYFSLREAFGRTARCDYRRLRELIEAATVVADPPNSWVDFQCLVLSYQNFNVSAFVSMLRRFNYQVVKKDIATFETSGQGMNTKANSCSTEIIAEAVRKRDRYQRFIFVSGEGSLLPAVRSLREAGKQVWVACLPQSINSTLKEEVDYIIDLDREVVWQGPTDD